MSLRLVGNIKVIHPCCVYSTTRSTIYPAHTCLLVVFDK